MDPVRERILLTAERMIAEHGAGVSLRDIAMAAGQRNNSAVQYHFGSRHGLIDTLVEYRIAALEARRLELLAQREAGDLDVRGLLAVLVEPMFNVPYQQGATHFARCLEQVRAHPALSDSANLTTRERPAVRVIFTRLDRALRDIPEPTRRSRLQSLPTVLFALLADHERGRGTPAGSDTAGVVDMLTGLLTAPVTSPTGFARFTSTNSTW